MSIFRRILSKKVPFPKTMDDTSRNFINALLSKDPSSRLGVKGVDDIKRNRFFAGIDWNAVSKLECKPPLKVALSSNTDVENFAAEFTKQEPIFSPGDGPVNYNGIFKVWILIARSYEHCIIISSGLFIRVTFGNLCHRQCDRRRVDG